MGFNATLTAKVISWLSVTHIVFPGFLIPILTRISFQSHPLLFSRASAEVKGKNTPEKKFASSGPQTHDHQVRSWTCSLLSHTDGAPVRRRFWKTLLEKEKMLVTSIFSFSHSVFYSIKVRNHHFTLYQTSPGFYMSAVQVF